MNEELIKKIERAIEDLSTDGITGWGLENIAPAIFRLVEVQASSGCTSSTCHHVGHDPAASVNKLIPLNGAVTNIGSDNRNDEETITYYIIDGNLYELHEPAHYWAWLVAVGDVPAWALAKLAIYNIFLRE